MISSNNKTNNSKPTKSNKKSDKSTKEITELPKIETDRRISTWIHLTQFKIQEMLIHTYLKERKYCQRDLWPRITWCSSSLIRKRRTKVISATEGQNLWFRLSRMLKKRSKEQIIWYISSKLRELIILAKSVWARERAERGQLWLMIHIMRCIGMKEWLKLVVEKTSRQSQTKTAELRNLKLNRAWDNNSSSWHI